eukprot:3815049-Amphidinium_carterae.1
MQQGLVPRQRCKQGAQPLAGSTLPMLDAHVFSDKIGDGVSPASAGFPYSMAMIGTALGSGSSAWASDRPRPATHALPCLLRCKGYVHLRPAPLSPQLEHINSPILLRCVMVRQVCPEDSLTAPTLGRNSIGVNRDALATLHNSSCTRC